jgi:hypothetical protein
VRLVSGDRLAGGKTACRETVQEDGMVAVVAANGTAVPPDVLEPVTTASKPEPKPESYILQT